MVRFSAPNYVGLEFMKWLSRLRNCVQLAEISGRLRPNTVPFLVCFPR